MMKVTSLKVRVLRVYACSLCVSVCVCFVVLLLYVRVQQYFFLRFYLTFNPFSPRSGRSQVCVGSAVARAGRNVLLLSTVSNLTDGEDN